MALLRERQRELAQVTDYSAEAIERQAEATRIVNEITRHYKDAAAETIAEIVNLTLAIDDQETAIQRLSQAFETVKQSQLRYAHEIAALEALRGGEGVDEGLLEIELERLKAEQILEVKRGYWEQELLEAQGYRAQIEAETAAHQKRLIDLETRHASQVGAVLKTIADIRTTEGRQQTLATLELVKQTGTHLATGSRKAFRISQAAAIAQATLTTIQGAQDAYASGLKIPAPPPIPQIAAVGFAAAALAPGYARVAEIRSQPPPQGFARGGIIDSPTFFSARNVSRGVAGEAGPEAILPVTRMRSGGFGVDAASAGNTVHLSFTPVIQVSAPSETEDPAEFGQSLALQLRRSLEPWLNQWARDQHRAGGVFNPTDRV